MVFNVLSVGLRCSGESAEGSGVVPHDESIPAWDIDDTEGDAVMDVDGALGLFEIGLEDVGLPVLDCFVMSGVGLPETGNI